MPLDNEDFIRCACGGADFRQETVLTFRKTLLPRDSKMMKLEAMETEYQYFCTKCGDELNR